MHFEQHYLQQNMRLIALREGLTANSTDDQRAAYAKNLNYSNCIMAVAKGKDDKYAEIVDTISDGPHEWKFNVMLRDLEYFIQDSTAESDNAGNMKNQAIEWAYPNGFDHHRASKTCILAAKNTTVASWNQAIQELNPSPVRELKSHDWFSEVDDPHGILAKVITEKVLSYYDGPGVPLHKLKLKVNDVCIVVRPIMTDDIATNTRVRILSISTNVIKVVTIEAKSRVLLLPRMHFKFRPYGPSFEMTRTQFPLRLAYAMTYNKSQSQTLSQVLVDCTEEPFAHGHLYVALSRVTNADHIRLFVREDMLQEVEVEDGASSNNKHVVVTNIVYKTVLPPDRLSAGHSANNNTQSIADFLGQGSDSEYDD